MLHGMVLDLLLAVLVDTALTLPTFSSHGIDHTWLFTRYVSLVYSDTTLLTLRSKLCIPMYRKSQGLSLPVLGETNIWQLQPIFAFHTGIGLQLPARLARRFLFSSVNSGHWSTRQVVVSSGWLILCSVTTFTLLALLILSTIRYVSLLPADRQTKANIF